jgi:hypothetical protein
MATAPSILSNVAAAAKNVLVRPWPHSARPFKLQGKGQKSQLMLGHLITVLQYSI